MKTAHSIAALLFVALASVTAPAFADEPANDAEAGARFAKGTEFYKHGEYKLALIEYERAYELAPNYRVLYNIGQVNGQLGNHSRALHAFRRYLDEGAAEIPEARRRMVEGEVNALLDRVASVRVVVNVGGAEVQIDGVPAGTAPLSEPMLLDAGQHVVRVSASGHETQSRVLVLAGRDAPVVRFDLRAEKAPVVAVVREPTRSVVPVAVGWSATGLFAVSGLVTGILSMNSQATLRGLRESRGYVSQDDLDHVESRARTYALVSDVSAAAAIVSAGIALYLTLRPDPKPATPRTGMAVSPTGVSGSF